MKRRAIFLDRDGTLMESEPYPTSIAQCRLYPFTIPALTLLSEAGYRLFVVTNQSGVASGLIKESEAQTINDSLRSEMSSAGVIIDEIFMCPHHSEDGCACRKPGMEFPTRARDTFDLDLAQSWSIGDSACDIELGYNFGGRSVLVRTGNRGADLTGSSRQPSFIADTLLEAAEYICTLHAT